MIPRVCLSDLSESNKNLLWSDPGVVALWKSDPDNDWCTRKLKTALLFATKLSFLGL